MDKNTSPQTQGPNPAYEQALRQATEELLGDTIGKLTEALARQELYKAEIIRLRTEIEGVRSAQTNAVQKTVDKQVVSLQEEIAALRRKFDAERRERVALENQLRSLNEAAQPKSTKKRSTRKKAS